MIFCIMSSDGVRTQIRRMHYFLPSKNGSTDPFSIPPLAVVVHWKCQSFFHSPQRQLHTDQYAVLGNFEDARGSGPADPEFCSNPQYKLTINKPTTISVSLLQDTTLMATGGNAIAEQEPISLVMYKAKGQPILWEFPDEELCAVGICNTNIPYMYKMHHKFHQFGA